MRGIKNACTNERGIGPELCLTYAMIVKVKGNNGVEK